VRYARCVDRPRQLPGPGSSSQTEAGAISVAGVRTHPADWRKSAERAWQEGVHELADKRGVSREMIRTIARCAVLKRWAKAGALPLG